MLIKYKKRYLVSSDLSKRSLLLCIQKVKWIR